MISKPIVCAVLLTLGLLAPGPTVTRVNSLGGWAARPAALLQVTRTSLPECESPRQEIRFEMLSRDAPASPPAGARSVCLAVYHPSEDAARP